MARSAWTVCAKCATSSTAMPGAGMPYSSTLQPVVDSAPQQCLPLMRCSSSAVCEGACVVLSFQACACADFAQNRRRNSPVQFLLCFQELSLRLHAAAQVDLLLTLKSFMCES